MKTQSGFWRGFVAAFAVIVTLHALTAWAKNEVQADAKAEIIAVQQEIKRLGDSVEGIRRNGITVKADQPLPVRTSHYDFEVQVRN